MCLFLFIYDILFYIYLFFVAVRTFVLQHRNPLRAALVAMAEAFVCLLFARLLVVVNCHKASHRLNPLSVFDFDSIPQALELKRRTSTGSVLSLIGSDLSVALRCSTSLKLPASTVITEALLTLFQFTVSPKH